MVNTDFSTFPHAKYTKIVHGKYSFLKASNILNHSSWGWTSFELDKKKTLQHLFTCKTYQNSVVTDNTVGPSKFVHFNPNIFLASCGVTTFRLQSPIRRQGKGNENDMSSSYYWYPKCICDELYEYLQHTSCSYKFHQHQNIAHAAYQKLGHRWDKGSKYTNYVLKKGHAVVAHEFQKSPSD
jgi:hypothetical protein